MKFFIKGTEKKVRESKTHHYAFALIRHYTNDIISCHTTKENAIKVMNSEKAEYNRHPFDYNKDYNPNENGFYELVELEER